MIFKCKVCGGSLDVVQGDRTAICEYCGIKQSISSFIQPKIQEIYDIANNYLAHNEFDKAENLYNQILLENKDNADAYWNVLMCRYGVTYVKDPATGKYIPTCNRTLYNPIFNDEYYQKAIKYADEEQKNLFLHNAKIIDDIQKGILGVSKNEKPFDIFISYKETDSIGARTKDSIKAQELYEKLTAEGYKVFFSRITLEDKVGMEYEPYIYSALASSKVMITVSSSRENLEAVWVKNEWSRFLSFAAKDSDKTLIPLYFDMEKSELPSDFSHLSLYNMATEGFEQDLIRGIKKLIPLPIMLLEQRKRRKKVLKKVGFVAITCAIIGVIISIPWFAKLPDYNTAMQLYYDKNYPEATWAFDELGSYRNSKEMKEKAENSWRKILANVIIDTYDGARSDGTYYIDNNGSVQKTDMSNLDIQLNVGEHGKVVSFAPNNKVNVIYEDGFVSNVSENVSNKEKWNDIIMMSEYFDDTTIALRADGTMIYDVINENKISNGNNNHWMKPITEWKDIVSFSAQKTWHDGYTYDSAIIIGLKSDGTYEKLAYNEPLEVPYLGVMPKLTGYGKSNENIIEVCYNGYILNDKGNFIDTSSDLVLLKDIVHISDNYAISRNGNVYFLEYDGSGRKIDNIRIPVYEEWMERMR